MGGADTDGFLMLSTDVRDCAGSTVVSSRFTGAGTRGVGGGEGGEPVVLAAIGGAILISARPPGAIAVGGSNSNLSGALATGGCETRTVASESLEVGVMGDAGSV